MRTGILLLTFLVINSLAGLALAQQTPDSYESALRLFQEQKYVDAIQQFEKTNQDHPDKVLNLYNWGLAAFETEKFGLALGLWRRAQYLAPNFEPAAQALSFAQSKMSAAVFSPPSAGSIERLKSGLLRRLSLGNILLLNFLLFVFTGWLSIRYFSSRKKALELEEEPPPIPFINLGFAVLFIASSLLLIIALDFRFEARATTIAANVSLKTAPQDTANSVFNLLEGSEVIIEDVENDWTLATYPGGMTGWIRSSEIFQSNGDKKW